MNKDLDRHIRTRITIISRGRKGDRENLHEHILSAAEESAGGGPVTKADVDAAFESLGTPAEIRQTFFPRQDRRVPAWAIVAFAASTLLAALDAFSTRSATCSSGDDGAVRCLVTAGNGLAVSLMSVMPPLIVLATHFFGPRWVPTTLAAAWLLLFIVPDVASDGLARSIGTLAAGAITTAAAALLWQREAAS